MPDLTINQKNFLHALANALRGVEAEPEQPVIEDLLAQAEAHHVLPLVFEAVQKQAAEALPPEELAAIRRTCMQSAMLQMMRTGELLRLLQALREAGVTPLVVKGLVCRQLYKKPDYRMSNDEDILIPPEQFPAAHQALLAFGMELQEPQQDTEHDFEVTYCKSGSPLRIELHKSLFEPESEVFSRANQYFGDAFEKSTTVTAGGIGVPTLNETQHLFYLICHAFKHFLHSGFGIRQVCDITLFANTYGKTIDWAWIRERCEALHADVFAAAVFRIGENYLTFDPKAACYPEDWRQLAPDETAMLEDLLDAGVYGHATMSRSHSSNITLNAVSAEKTGKQAGNSVLKTVFPSAKQLSGRYQYLKGKPYLLPVAWADRILKYGRETAAGSEDNRASESIRIGNERIELLRQYGILGRRDGE